MKKIRKILPTFLMVAILCMSSMANSCPDLEECEYLGTELPNAEERLKYAPHENQQEIEAYVEQLRRDAEAAGCGFGKAKDQ